MKYLKFVDYLLWGFCLFISFLLFSFLSLGVNYYMSSVNEVLLTPVQRINDTTFEMIPPYSNDEIPIFKALNFKDHETVTLTLNNGLNSTYSAVFQQQSDHSLQFTNPQDSQLYQIDIVKLSDVNTSENQISIQAANSDDDSEQILLQKQVEKDNDSSFVFVPFVFHR